MNFSPFYFPHFLKGLLGGVVIMTTLMSQTEAMQAAIRMSNLRRITPFAHQAETAAQKGDLEGVSSALAQVESFHNSPYLARKAAVASLEVQQILQRTMQAVAEIHLKAAEEAQREGDAEKAKASLKQMEDTLQNLPTFIAGPVTLPEQAQKRLDNLNLNIIGKAKEEAHQKEEYEKQALEMAQKEREKEEAIQKRLAELAEENRREAERRKAQESKKPSVESTDHSHSYQEGQSLASSRLGDVTPSNPAIIPGYAGTEVPQSNIKAHDLGEEALKASASDEASQLITEGFEKGDKYVIDPHTDPLIVAANKVIADPQGTLDESNEETGEEGEFVEETKVCEESGEETLESVEEIRNITVSEPPKHTSTLSAYSHGWGGGLSRNIVTGAKYDGSTTNTPCYAAYTTVGNLLPAHLQSRFKSVQFSPGYSCPGGASFSSNGTISISTVGGRDGPTTSFSTSVEITLKPGEENISENIVTNGHNLDDRVDKGLCSYEEIQIIEGPQTRVINEVPVTREWWRRRKIYRCHYPAKNDCAALRAKGCYQVNSSCKEKVGDVCVVWEQTYKCPSGKKIVKSFRSSNKANPFCLSGDCADKSYAPNKDFAETMSLMSVLKEAGDDLKNFGSIFKGLDWRCTRHCIGFKDCCGNGNGWGISLNLASCDKVEQTLADLRAKKRCIQVGTYCAEKKLGVCIRKKTTFCCYDTKLARIVQEQGKRQLGLGFGDPKQPQCQGLSIEQLAQLDFSSIDFSDMLADIVGSIKTPSPDKLMSGIQQSMQDRGTFLKVKEKVGTQSMDFAQINEEPAKVRPEVLSNPSLPQPPLPPNKINKPANVNVQPSNKSPQDYQTQGRSHGQF
jgi:conjugal transfer mating pair stabilization protein TraN